MDFKEELKQYQQMINKELAKYVEKTNCPEKLLNNSMEYSLMAGGKRLRPILVISTYKLFKKEDIDQVMKDAVEYRKYGVTDNSVIMKAMGFDKNNRTSKESIKRMYGKCSTIRYTIKSRDIRSNELV